MMKSKELTRKGKAKQGAAPPKAGEFKFLGILVAIFLAVSSVALLKMFKGGREKRNLFSLYRFPTYEKDN